MKRLGLSRGIAAIAMLLGNPGILGGADILPLSNHHQRRVRDYSGWNRAGGFVPHIGVKQHSKTANQVDGPMHRSPNIVRSNDWKRTQAGAVTQHPLADPKPARKPRAKKAA